MKSRSKVSVWSAEVVRGINVKTDVEIFHWTSWNLTCGSNWPKIRGGWIFKGSWMSVQNFRQSNQPLSNQPCGSKSHEVKTTSWSAVRHQLKFVPKTTRHLFWHDDKPPWFGKGIFFFAYNWFIENLLWYCMFPSNHPGNYEKEKSQSDVFPLGAQSLSSSKSYIRMQNHSGNGKSPWRPNSY